MRSDDTVARLVTTESESEQREAVCVDGRGGGQGPHVADEGVALRGQGRRKDLVLDLAGQAGGDLKAEGHRDALHESGGVVAQERQERCERGDGARPHLRQRRLHIAQQVRHAPWSLIRAHRVATCELHKQRLCNARGRPLLAGRADPCPVDPSPPAAEPWGLDKQKMHAHTVSGAKPHVSRFKNQPLRRRMLHIPVTDLWT